MSFPTSPPLGGAPRPWSFPTTHTTTLANGLTVVVLPTHRVPIVQLRLVSRVGRWAEPLPGLGRLMAMTTRHGTARFDSAALARYQDALGVRISSSLSPDDRSVAVKGLAEHAGPCFELLAELALRPTFPAEHVQREAHKSAEARRAQLGRPDSLASEWFSWAVYGRSHVYGQARPQASDYEARTPAELAAWHRGCFGPQDALLVIVGDIAPDQAMEQARRGFEAWSGGGSCPPIPTDVPSGARRVVLVDRKDSEQATLLVGNRGWGRSTPGFDDSRVMNRILGGGAASRLFLDLREKRSLTYGVYSSLDGGRFGGDFSAGLSCSTEKTAEALSALDGHLRRIRDEPVSDDELDAARQFLVGAFPMGTASLGGLASLVSSRWLNQLPDDVWETFMPRVAAVSVERVQELARELVRPDDATLVVVGEGDALHDVCAQYGEVLRVTPEDRPPAR